MAQGSGQFSWTTPNGLFPSLMAGPFGNGLLFRVKAQFAVITLVAGLVSITMMPSDAASQAAPVTQTWCVDKASTDILGDSATEGTGNVDPNNSWVAKMRRTNPNTQITAHAHGGAMVSDFLDGGRFPETTAAVDKVAVSKPALVIIELGGNEYHHDVDPEQYRANLGTLTNRLKAASPRSTLLYLTIWPFERRSSTTAHHYDEYAEVARQSATQAGGWWVDMRQFFPSTAAGDEHTKLISPDGIHANDAGNAVVHAAVHTYLHRC